MQIGELAKQGGVSVQTVRYYERSGLLGKADRKPSRYRIYSEKDVQRLRFIRHAKTLGFTPDEIKHVLQLREARTCPCGQVKNIGEERLAALEAQIAGLTRFRDQLAHAVREWKKCPDEAPQGDAICVLIERTMMETDRKGELKQCHSSKAKSTSARTRTAAAKLR
jgi:MerR family copper efflux transcriptional regulator